MSINPTEPQCEAGEETILQKYDRLEVVLGRGVTVSIMAALMRQIGKHHPTAEQLLNKYKKGGSKFRKFLSKNEAKLNKLINSIDLAMVIKPQNGNANSISRITEMANTNPYCKDILEVFDFLKEAGKEKGLNQWQDFVGLVYKKNPFLFLVLGNDSENPKTCFYRFTPNYRAIYFYWYMPSDAKAVVEKDKNVVNAQIRSDGLHGVIKSVPLVTNSISVSQS